MFMSWLSAHIEIVIADRVINKIEIMEKVPGRAVLALAAEGSYGAMVSSHSGLPFVLGHVLLFSLLNVCSIRIGPLRGRLSVSHPLRKRLSQI